MHHGHDHVDDSYYLDQLCLIGLSAGFGGVCLSLYFLNPSMLNLVLGSQFHPFVLWSGFILVGLAALRAVVLWREAGQKKQLANNNHSEAASHAEHHHHEETECGHDHEHEHGPACDHSHGEHHAHGHSHSQAHGHSHGTGDHSHADHDHGWAPWRYVLLLLPIFLFLLGLPNKGPAIRPPTANLDLAADTSAIATGVGALAGVSADPWVFAAKYAALGVPPPVTALDFKTLEAIAYDADARRKSGVEAGSWVKVVGQIYIPDRQQNDRMFYLVRFRIQCCGPAPGRNRWIIPRGTWT